MTQQNRAIVEGVYDSFAKGDLEGVLNRLDENIVWRTPGSSDLPTSGIRHGHGEVRDFFQLLATLFDFEDFRVDAMVAESNRVVVLGSDTLVMKDSRVRIPMRWAHVYTLRWGKVAVFDEYLDTAAIAAEYHRAALRA